MLSHSSYRHEALFYRGDDGFLAGTVPFLREGIAAGQPVMAAVTAPHLVQLREALGADADSALLVDMQVLGGNPACIIPAWQAFLTEHGGAGEAPRPLRGVGEPVWAGRRAEELAECALHEALLNVAVHPDAPLWLRCPYDLDTLPHEVVEEAHRSHPALIEAGEYRGSTSYGGIEHVEASFTSDLPAHDEQVDAFTFWLDDLPQVRDLVAQAATAAGLDDEHLRSLQLVVHELAVNSATHGGGNGSLRLWQQPGSLVAEIRDHGRLSDPLSGRREPDLESEGGRGLWLANQLCDLVQVRRTYDGTVVRVHTWLRPTADPLPSGR